MYYKQKNFEFLKKKITLGNGAKYGPTAKITMSIMMVLIRATIWVLTPMPSAIKQRDIPTHPGYPLKNELTILLIP